MATKPVYVLGVNGNVHDSSVALLRDGEAIFAIEEERLNRHKHFGGAPTLAVKKALEVGGITFADLACVAIPWLAHRYWRYTFFHNLWRAPTWPALHLHEMVAATDRYFLYLNDVRHYAARAPTVTYDHHFCHAASAFLVSPFDEAAILCCDARGEDVSTTWHVGEGRRIRTLRRIGVRHSLGHIYAQITSYLGFGANDEYKVMGLAPYGQPAHLDFFRAAVRLLPGGECRVNRAFFDYYRGYSPRLLVLGPPRREDQPLTRFHMDMAASVQRAFEEWTLHMARHLRRATGKRFLCVAGGCGLNAVANGRLAREAGFDDIYVQPAASDQGLALGAAYARWCIDMGQPRPPPMERADLGLEITTDHIDRALAHAQVEAAVAPDPSLAAARLLAAGKVIGWVFGRSEFGPRALGERSILADPRPVEMRERVNAKIKNREGFRPFAPAIMEEWTDRVFETGRRLPFMVFVYNVRPEWRDRLPAITHVDGSARIQTVDRRLHPEYYRVIEEFHRLTGVPVILNTSFNLQGEPMVETAYDALRTFASSGLDALFLRDRLVVKRPESRALALGEGNAPPARETGDAAGRSVAGW
ncbi:MAG: carbamoyltransferase [Planctomycetes bacterium]|nr:carbamoyltransferase [Planctomycetota bacterium]